MIRSKRSKIREQATKINELELINERMRAQLQEERAAKGILLLSSADRAIKDGAQALAFESEITEGCFDGLRAELSWGASMLVEQSEGDLGLKIAKRGGIFYLIMQDDERILMRSKDLAIMIEMRALILERVSEDPACFCDDLACASMPEHEQISITGTKIPGRADQMRYCTLVMLCAEDHLRDLREEIIDELS